MNEFIGEIAGFDVAKFVLAAALAGAVTGTAILVHEGLYAAGFLLMATAALLSFVFLWDLST